MADERNQNQNPKSPDAGFEARIREMGRHLAPRPPALLGELPKPEWRDPFFLAKALDAGLIEIGRPEYCITAAARMVEKPNGQKKLEVGGPEVRCDAGWSWTDLKHPKSKNIFGVLEEDAKETDPRIKIHVRLTAKGMAQAAA